MEDPDADLERNPSNGRACSDEIIQGGEPSTTIPSRRPDKTDLVTPIAKASLASSADSLFATPPVVLPAQDSVSGWTIMARRNVQGSSVI